MVRNDEGLTKTYNRFHDPNETRPGDRSPPRAARRDGPRRARRYGWNDIPTDCEFLLDYEVDEEDDSRRKKPYRYRWPDEVRDEVLARLIELNAERAAAEQRSGAAGAKQDKSRSRRPAPVAGRSRRALLMEAASVDRESPATSEEVRERLVEALELDLVGPPAGHRYEHELLPGWERPSKWYLTGFLIPKDAPPEEAGDDDANDEFDDVSETEGPAEESAEERAAAKRSYFPSSMGISALVAAHTESLSVTVRWGDYEYEDLTRKDEEESADEPEGRDGGGGGDDGGTEEGEDGARGGRGARSVWRRTPREEKIDLVLGGSAGTPHVAPVPGSDGLELHVLEREIGLAGLDGHIPAGTRSVSLFLVNNRTAGHEPSGPRLRLPSCPRDRVRPVVRPASRSARLAGRRVGRAGCGSALRGHAGVRHGSWRICGLGDR